MAIYFNSYRHHTINDFEKLLKEKEGLENNSIIKISILIKISIYIGLSGFLDTSISEVVFSINGNI